MFKFFMILLVVVSLPLNVNGFSNELSSESAILIEQSTKKVLFSKNHFKKMKPASTTKILTALTTIQNAKLDEIVTVSENAENTEGSSMYIEKGEKISMENLLYGLMMNSGNDAAVAIAEHISKTPEEFSKLMNETAENSGAFHSNFINANGLDHDEHYTTAHDLALITAKAMEYETFRNLVKQQTKIVETTDGVKKYLKNHNKLLNMYEGCEGVKTGFTKASGRTLVSSAIRDGMRLIAVTMNAPDDWNDHIKMLDYGFENYELMTFLRKDIVCVKGKVDGGVKSYVSLTPEKTVTYTVNKNESDLYRVEYRLKNNTAPVKTGEHMGDALIIKEDKITETVRLLALENIEEMIINKNYGEIFNIFISSFLYKYLK